jgi:hypothetical protein
LWRSGSVERSRKGKKTVFGSGRTEQKEKKKTLIMITHKIYYSQIYLLYSNFIHMIFDFQLDCMKSFEILHLIHVTNPITWCTDASVQRVVF